MAHFEVYISDEGLAEIDGLPLLLVPGQSVHEAVLDELHRHAQERGAAVEATVNDGPGTTHFVLQVSPDGSSRVLVPAETTEPGPEPEWIPEPVPAPAAVVHTPAAVIATAPATVPATSSAVATAIARARATSAARAAAPAPAVTMDLPAGTTGPCPVTPELAEPITRINALVAVGRLDEAFADATALRESLTSSVGAGHPDALEARAVEAYIAHLRGDHREAVVLALAVARIRCGARDVRAPEEVARAAAAWQELDDDQAVLAHGSELLHMWEALERRGLLTPGHAKLARKVRRQVDALAAYV